MPVSKDATPDTQMSEVLSLFPPTLKGKKLIRDDSMAYRIDSTYLDHLEKYLESRNPDFLVKAVRLRPDLLKGKGRNFDVEEYLIEKGDKTIKPTTYVNASTIVGETIRWWQLLHQLGDDNEAKVVKNFLRKVISPAEIIPRGHKEIISEDGLKHVIYNLKGKKPFLTFHNPPEEFITKYTHAKRIFQRAKTKKRYGLFDGELEKKDTLNALNELGFRYESEEVLHYFNLSNAHTKAISYLCQVHIKCCLICRKHGLSDDSISRLLKRAKLEVSSSKEPNKTMNDSKE